MKVRQKLGLAILILSCAPSLALLEGQALAGDSEFPSSGVVGGDKDAGGGAGITGSGIGGAKRPSVKPPVSSEPSAGMKQLESQFGLQSCGFECTYLKANENLALQAVYISKQLQLLESPEGSSEKARAEYLGAMRFCEPKEKETTAACYQRFRRMNLAALRKIKQYMAQNNETAAKLQGGTGLGAGAGADDLPPSAVYEMPRKEGLQPVLPYVHTWNDVQSEFKNLKGLTSDDYRKWQSGFGSGIYKPEKSDFAKFKEIPRDPKHPEMGNFRVVAMKPTGEIDYDEKRYAAAMARYQSQKEIKDKDIKGAEVMDSDHERSDAQILLGRAKDTVGGQRVDPAHLHYLQQKAFKEAQREVTRGVSDSLMKDSGLGSVSQDAKSKSAPSEASGNDVVRAPADASTDRPVTYDAQDMDSLVYMNGGYDNDTKAAKLFAPDDIEERMNSDRDNDKKDGRKRQRGRDSKTP